MEHIICAHCGAIIESEDSMITAYDDKTFCDEDCAHAAGYDQCEDCGAWENDCIAVLNVGMVCNDCLISGDYYRCEDCGDYFRELDMQHDSLGDLHVCNDCCDASWHTCYNCGALIHDDDTMWIQDEPYCNDCANDMEDDEIIHDYSYKPDPIFYDTHEDFAHGIPLYMGVELEVDKGNQPGDLAEHLQNNVSQIYCKYDGSLDSGVEIVSHPCTLAYHMEDLDWEWISLQCVNAGFTSHDANTCGLHVHVNRSFFGTTPNEIDLNIAKVILLVNRFWESHLIPFSRRTESQLSRWAQKNDMDLEDGDNDYTLTCKAREQRRKGRYYAVNLTNTNTIEFRFFRGTLKLSTFYATLEFVDTLCRFAKKININDINTTTWEDIFRDVAYPDLIQYLSAKTNFHRQQEAA